MEKHYLSLNLQNVCILLFHGQMSAVIDFITRYLILKGSNFRLLNYYSELYRYTKLDKERLGTLHYIDYYCTFYHGLFDLD